jgi:hypothetical protein
LSGGGDRGRVTPANSRLSKKKEKFILNHSLIFRTGTHKNAHNGLDEPGKKFTEKRNGRTKGKEMGEDDEQEVSSSEWGEKAAKIAFLSDAHKNDVCVGWGKCAAANRGNSRMGALSV